MTPHKAGLLRALTSAFPCGMAAYRFHRFGAGQVVIFIVLAAALAALGYSCAYHREKNKPAASDWNLDRFRQNSRKRGW